MRWPAPTVAELVARYENDKAIVIDVKYARRASDIEGVDAGTGKLPPRDQLPFAPYELTARLWFPRNAGKWWLTQILAIRNTASVSWELTELHHGAHPAGRAPEFSMILQRSDAEAGWAYRDFDCVVMNYLPVRDLTVRSKVFHFIKNGKAYPGVYHSLRVPMAPGKSFTVATPIPFAHAVIDAKPDHVYPGAYQLFEHIVKTMKALE
ncbi:MAG: hypothetical protein D6820_17450 [Lentisphaerae bacterium]|nr:MAG: hypothetical protein D6820_17450 [Lentisphaerota bacterium]